MMDQFEEKLIDRYRQDDSPVPDADLFLAGFHGLKKEKELKRYRLLSGFAAVLVVAVLGYFTVLQFEPVQYEIMYMTGNDDPAEIFQTDLWSINMDHDTSSSDDYIADLTLFLLEEDDLWETLDLIHDIYNDNDIKHEETL